MADKSEFENMSWFQRATDKSMPTTEANETVRTASLKNKDFLTGFKNHEEATNFSQMISKLIDMKRNENKALTND